MILSTLRSRLIVSVSKHPYVNFCTVLFMYNLMDKHNGVSFRTILPTLATKRFVENNKAIVPVKSNPLVTCERSKCFFE